MGYAFTRFTVPDPLPEAGFYLQVGFVPTVMFMFRPGADSPSGIRVEEAGNLMRPYAGGDRVDELGVGGPVFSGEYYFRPDGSRTPDGATTYAGVYFFGAAGNLDGDEGTGFLLLSMA